MNILPKKRWHVRTKENIARVRRDETQAAEEEKQRVQRAKLAEQEARTTFLRTQARLKYDPGYKNAEPGASSASTCPSTTNTTTTQVADIYTAAGNINFFKDLEEGKRTGGKNEEYEKEKKEEQEKYEKSIGYLTYLGQESIEAQGKKAWYEEVSGRTIYRGDEGEQHEVGLKSKDKLDPIHDIIKYGGIKPMKKTPGVPKPNTSEECIPTMPKQDAGNEKPMQQSKSSVDKKRKRRHKDSRKRKKTKRSKRRKRNENDEEVEEREKKDGHRERGRKRQGDDNSSDEDSRARKRRTSNHKKRSKERESRKRHYSNNSSSSSSTSNIDSYESSEDEEAIQEKKKKLEILRAERLKREAEERRRANRLLAGKKPDESDEPPKQPTIHQKYNTQFNPHLARQNQEQQGLQANMKYWLQ